MTDRPAQLPIFEGDKIDGIALAVTGSTDSADGQIRHRGDEVTLLITGTIREVAFKTKDDRLIRVEKVKVAEAHIVDGPEAWELLTRTREADRKALDRLLGRRRLDDTDND